MQRQLFFFATLLVVILATTMNAQQRWTKVLDAPKYGIASLVAFPQNPDTMYAIGDAFYRSIDGGRQWAAVAAESSLHGSLKIADRHSQLLFAAVPGFGEGEDIIHSSDAGVTWKRTLSGLGRSAGGRLVLETVPDNDSTVYVTAGRNYRSADYGATWDTLTSPPFGTLGRFFRNAVAPNIGYVADGTSLVRTSNRVTWQRAVLPPDFPIKSIAVDPLTVMRAYVLQVSDTSVLVWKSTNIGASWQMFSRGLVRGSGNVMFMEVNPVQSSEIIIGMENDGTGVLQRSNDYGETWGKWNDDLPAGATATALVFDTLRGAMVLGVQERNGGGGIYIRDIVTGVENADDPLPASFALHQNYPNPFNPRTTITYDVPSRSHVRLDVVNVLGQAVRVLVNGEVEAGSQSVVFDGAGLSSGVYLVRMRTDGAGVVAVRKMVLVE